MMVVDLTLFSEDFMALEIRLHELSPVVDLFLICESNFSFSGKRKPFYLSDNIEKFSKFKDKIRIVKFEIDQPRSNPWAQESSQRIFLSNAAHEIGLGPKDLVISSDCDEIPRLSILQELLVKSAYESINALLVLRNFTTYINVCSGYYRRGRVISYKLFKNSQKLRGDIYIYDNWENRRSRFPVMRVPNHFRSYPDHSFPEFVFQKPVLNVVEEGGWHFNHLMREESLMRKVHYSSHIELVEAFSEEKLNEALITGGDLYGLQSTQVVRIDESFPEFIRTNLEKFDPYIYKEHLG